ncbi:protein CPR-5 [Silene latifolia]|uniref:protein CPR-5 n=1 Tax=Silene latifolia TaxID=37657 RepID=UPI003D76D99E
MGVHRPTIPDDDPPSISTAHQNPKPQINGHNPTRRPKKKRVSDDATSATSSLTSTYPINNSNSNSLSQRGIRIPNKRRFHFRRNHSDVEAIAFPLGMSIAAVFAQVLEKKDLVADSASVEYLSKICTSAVRESLTNVFGEKFDAFAINFEKSFGSTLNTIRLVRSEINNGGNLGGNSYVSNCLPDKIPPSISSITGECSLRNNDITEGCRESVDHGEASQYCKRDENRDHVASQCGNQELPMQGIVSLQLACSDPRSLSNHSMLTTIKKSVSEQTRANDLKSVEISLMMKKMQMKEVQLALDSDSNFLEKCKLSLGISRTSFKVEKFKTQVEETKHGELLKELADFLVTGLIIMSFCLCCGVYTFSLDNLRELTKSCYPPEGSKSWWKPMASLNVGWQTLSCQVQVYSRIIFGGLIIGAVAMTLIQRSDIARQGMPITSIVLLLGLLGGFVGKICVDTLGGNGYTWLMFWEVLCSVHFFSITFAPFLYSILYGAVQVCQVAKYRILFPFWVRRCLFRIFLLLLPVSCGLLPFASGKTWWEDHISTWIKNRWLAAYAEQYDVGFHE